jgi:hypothetical protein
MAEQRPYRWFFILAIIYAILKIAESFIVTIPVLGQIFGIILFPISLAWLILSIILLVKFIMIKLSGVYLVLPIYYIADFILSFMVGIVVGVSAMASGVSDPIGGASWLIYITAIGAIFETGYAIFMLVRR